MSVTITLKVWVNLKQCVKKCDDSPFLATFLFANLRTETSHFRVPVSLVFGTRPGEKTFNVKGEFVQRGGEDDK